MYIFTNCYVKLKVRGKGLGIYDESLGEKGRGSREEKKNGPRNMGTSLEK